MTKVDKRKKGINPPRCHHKHLVKIFQFLSKLCHASYSSSFFMVPSVKNILLWRKVSFLFFSFFPFSSFPFSFFLFLFPFPFHSFSFNFHSSLRPSSFQLLFQFQNLWFYLICSVLKDGNGCVFLLVCQSGQSEFCHFDQINFGFCW